MNNHHLFLCALSVLIMIPNMGYSSSQPVYSENTEEGFLRVTNSHYEVTLSASSGAILGIRQMPSGEEVSKGTLGGHLWHVDFPKGPGIGGGHFGNIEGSRGTFSHSWDSENRSLRFEYLPEESIPGMEARVTLSFSESSHFDLHIQLRNLSGDRLRSVALPHCLAFDGEKISEAYFPVLPGIRFNERFFQEGRSWYHGHYPRNTVFADFAHFRTGSGSLGMVSFLETDLTPIVRRQLYPDPEKALYVWRHDFEVVEPDGATWISPIVRIHVGSTLLETVDAWRQDSGMSVSPSIREKLGADYDRVARALNTKLDVRSMMHEFGLLFGDTEGYRNLWKTLPGPAILFICSFPRGGQDDSNPDIFPVDPELGTDEEFGKVFGIAREMGHRIMPYVNPSFWDDKSETAQSLRLEEFAAMYREGIPHREEYSGHSGYAVCPHAPAVRERLEGLMREIQDKLPIHHVWQDQVGSRYGLDFNPHVPNPIEHAQGWLEHTRRYAHLGLMAEHGHDRMVPYHIGFQGNLLLYEAGGDFGDSEWGAGTWEYYPLVPMMARDKIFFYNAPDHYVRSRKGLTWVLAMGQLPSYDIHVSTLNTPWHKTTALLQELVLSRFAHERVLAFEKISPTVTRTQYETFSVLAHQSKDKPFAHGNHEIAPEGFLIEDLSGKTIAGLFTRFNSVPLSEGDHCIVMLREDKETILYHLMGPDTEITVSLPEKDSLDSITVLAETSSGTIPVSFDREEKSVRFRMERSIRDEETIRYIVR